MLQNELKEKLKKVKFQNKITIGVAGASLALAIVFGTLYLLNRTHPVTTSGGNETLTQQVEDLNQQDDEANQDLTALMNQQLDSLSIVIDTLNRRLTRAKTEIEQAQISASTYTVDHIAQLIEHAKEFSNTNCNKSLAFLYAAKKVSQMDGTSNANKQAINSMIHKCEEAVFGKKPGEDAPTSSIENSPSNGGQ